MLGRKGVVTPTADSSEYLFGTNVTVWPGHCKCMSDNGSHGELLVAM